MERMMGRPMARMVAGVAGVLLASGCAQGLRLPETGDDDQYFVLRIPGAATEARMSREGLSGSDVQMTRYEHSLRGRAYGNTVELNWTEEQVTGNVGGSPVDLKVEQEENELRIRGLYAGRVGNFSIQPGQLQGTIGQCTYTMETDTGGIYTGNMVCGGGPVDATLQLPPMLAAFYPAEIAAYLAAFLGR